MTMSIRAIYGWQDPFPKSRSGTLTASVGCRRLPIDDEMCECGDITDRGEEPDYDLETLKLMTTIVAVAEKAAARKAKRSKRAATDKADKPASKKARTGPSPAAAAAQVPSCTLWAFC